MFMATIRDKYKLIYAVTRWLSANSYVYAPAVNMVEFFSCYIFLCV